MKSLINVVSNFAINERVVAIERFGQGLINDSYKVITIESASPKYVLQRINNAVFNDVDLLQTNIQKVTSHIRTILEKRREPDIDRKVLHFIPTVDGKSYHFDGEKYWRLMVYIRDSITHQAITPHYAEITGRAFGNFQSMLIDIKEPIGEVIPNFHNVEFRLEQMRSAFESDAFGRAHSVRCYVEAIERRANEMCFAEGLFREGKLPKRICHCDTKVNNILFDTNGSVLCVIDLDTVMPSYIFSDFGDFLRSAANTGAEDDTDLNNIRFNMDIFEVFARGYIECTSSFLLPVERENLPRAALLFPYMQAVRFLTDYLNGDKYYKIQYSEHNLVRTKAQWRLFESADEKMAEMQRVVRGITAF